MAYTYKDTYNTLTRELWNTLQKMSSEDNLNARLNELAKHHQVELTSDDTYSIKQVWHDGTHMVKRTVFYCPKKLMKEHCRKHESGDTKPLTSALKVLIRHALEL